MPSPIEESGRSDPQFQKILNSLQERLHQESEELVDFSEIEKLVRKPDNEDMAATTNLPTREEFEARIQAGEARSDARFIAFEKRVDDSMHKIELELAPLKNIKMSIWGAAATIIATFIAAFTVYVAAFDSGRDTAKLAADAQIKAAQAQTEAATSLSQIRQIVSDLKQAAPAASPPPAEK